MEKRTCDLNIRLTEKELEYLKKCSESSSCRFKNGRDNFSDYLRSLLFAASGYRDEAYIKQLRNLQYEIRKIGTNINQITRKINSGYIGSSDDLTELKECLFRIEIAFEEVKASHSEPDMEGG